MTTRRDRGPSPDPKRPAPADDRRGASDPSLEELKALANATIYGATPGAKPTMLPGAASSSVPEAGRDRATRTSHAADRIESADRLPVAPGAQRTRRPARSTSTSPARAEPTVRSGTAPPRPELTPGTSVVLAELRSTLAERRDEVFSMALEPTESSEVDHYLRGRTQGLSEALLLLEQRLVDRANHG